VARFVRADQVNEQPFVDGNTKWAASRASLTPFGEYFFVAVFTSVFDDVGICLFEAAFQQSDRMGFTVAGIPSDDDGAARAHDFADHFVERGLDVQLAQAGYANVVAVGAFVAIEIAQKGYFLVVVAAYYQQVRASAAALATRGKLVTALPASAVTAETLLNAQHDDANWIVPAKTYAGNRYTGLSQIDKTNVGALRMAWKTKLADDGEQEAAPIVWNGIMYLSTPQGFFPRHASYSVGAIPGLPAIAHRRAGTCFILFETQLSRDTRLWPSRRLAIPSCNWPVAITFLDGRRMACNTLSPGVL